MSALPDPSAAPSADPQAWLAQGCDLAVHWLPSLVKDQSQCEGIYTNLLSNLVWATPLALVAAVGMLFALWRRKPPPVTDAASGHPDLRPALPNHAPGFAPTTRAALLEEPGTSPRDTRRAAPRRAAAPGDNESFNVFLSHNSRDKPTVRQLAKALQARGLKVWLDEEQLVPGRPWQDALEKIIQTAHTAAVLVGKDGLGPWEDPEMRACLSEFVKRRMPVIPVLLPDAPVEPKLPLFLRSFTWVDLRHGLTDQGLDLLEWGVTDTKPDRLPSILQPPHPVKGE